MRTHSERHRAAAAAALCWVALGVESIVRPERHDYREAVWMVPWALTALAFVRVHAAQRGRSRVEAAGFALTMAAMLLVLLGNVGLLAEEPHLAAFGFPLGAALWAGALLVFGAGTWRAGVLPRSAAVALALLEPGSVLTGLLLSPIAPLHERGGYSAGVEKGLALAVVAMGLRRRPA